MVHRRRADLARAIDAMFGVLLVGRTISTVLRRLGRRRLLDAIPASRARRSGADVRQANFADLVDAALPEHALGRTLELWWQEEARSGQQGTLTRVWAQPGSRPVAPRNQRYSWAHLFGAVCLA